MKQIEHYFCYNTHTLYIYIYDDKHMWFKIPTTGICLAFHQTEFDTRPFYSEVR